MTDDIDAPDTLAPLFTIELGDNGGILEPFDFPELEDWLSKEIQFWQILTKNPYQNSGRVDPLHAPLTKLRAIHVGAKKAEGSSVLSLESAITDLYITRRFPHSASIRGKRIQAYADEHGEGVETYARFMSANDDESLLVPTTTRQWRAMLRGLIHRYHLLEEDSEGMEGVRAAMDQATSRILQEHSDFKRLTDEFREEVRLTDQECKTMLSRHELNLGEAKEKHVELTTSHLNEMDRIRKTYREEMALRAPSTYWTSKQRHHRNMALFWGVVTGAFLLAAVLLLWNNAKDFLEPTPISSITTAASSSSKQSQTPTSTTDPTPVIKEALRQDAWRLGVFALMAIFGFWAVRLVVRMFLSHLHLHTDASERMVMLQTYLALTEADKLADKDDRTLILQALFRPASDGIVKDEAAPPSIGEWLTRSGKS